MAGKGTGEEAVLTSEGARRRRCVDFRLNGFPAVREDRAFSKRDVDLTQVILRNADVLSDAKTHSLNSRLPVQFRLRSAKSGRHS